MRALGAPLRVVVEQRIPRVIEAADHPRLRVAFGAYARSRRRKLTEIAEKVAAEAASGSASEGRRGSVRVGARRPVRLATDGGDG